MFAYGIVSYEHYHLSVYRADMSHGAEIRDYRIAVSNKMYQPANLTITIEGLPHQSYTLSESETVLMTAGRNDIKLHINADMPPGLHTFIVHALSNDGWHDSFRVQHFVGRG